MLPGASSIGTSGASGREFCSDACRELELGQEGDALRSRALSYLTFIEGMQVCLKTIVKCIQCVPESGPVP